MNIAAGYKNDCIKSNSGRRLLSYNCNFLKIKSQNGKKAKREIAS